MTPDDSRRISLLLGLLFGLAGLGSASAAIAVPLVAEHFDVSVGVGTWMISVYVLMLGVATAVYGRVSDLIGPRIPFLVGIALMVIGAIGAALAPTFALLIVARILQGAGVAAIPTLGVAIISARYDGDIRGLAFGRLAAMAAFVTCLGPLLGGLLEEVAGWRGVLALPVLGLVVVPVHLARPGRRGVARPARHLRRPAGGRDRGRPDPGDPVAVERLGRGAGRRRSARARHARRRVPGTPPAARLPARARSSATPPSCAAPWPRPRSRPPGSPSWSPCPPSWSATAGSPTRSACCSCPAPRSRCSCRG